MKKFLPLVAVIAALAVVGCQSDAPVSDSGVRNKDGEVEGKAPTFKMVPAQKDPASQGK